MAGPLAPVTEYVLMGALLNHDIAPEDLDVKTLSHTGQRVWKAVQSLGADFDKRGVEICPKTLDSFPKSWGRFQHLACRNLPQDFGQLSKLFVRYVREF